MLDRWGQFGKVGESKVRPTKSDAMGMCLFPDNICKTMAQSSTLRNWDAHRRQGAGSHPPPSRRGENLFPLRCGRYVVRQEINQKGPIPLRHPDVLKTPTRYFALDSDKYNPRGSTGCCAKSHHTRCDRKCHKPYLMPKSPYRKGNGPIPRYSSGAIIQNRRHQPWSIPKFRNRKTRNMRIIRRGANSILVACKYEATTWVRYRRDALLHLLGFWEYGS